MASDSTSIADLPGGNNVEQQNRVVLEKTEMQNVNSNQQPPIAPHQLNCLLIQLIKLLLDYNKHPLQE
jgi:hypothetical protein